MQYCNHCKVHIRQYSERCPLCRNLLACESNTNKEKIFPEIKAFFKRHLAIKIMIFISITSIVVSFAITMIFPSHINWPLLFLLGLTSIWLSLYFILKKRHNIPKKIIWQVIIVSILSVFWDWKTGWHGWSLDFIIPITYIGAMIVMYVTSKIMKLSIRDYILYGFLACLFGILPLLFLLLNWNNIIYLSVICVSISIIFLSAMLIFHGSDMELELKKRMHL